jgi:1-deoxy-D-xylulose 5-phosphate reductoisomerase
VLPDSIRRDLAGSGPELVATARFLEVSKLEFSTPRYDDFPALNLARRAGEIGGTLPAVMNAANEIASRRF